MGYSLDKLLEVSGVDRLSGRQLAKTAAAQEVPSFSKLADRCRQAAEATPEEVGDSRSRDIIEKTAEVAIIGRVLAEIQAIEGAIPLEKTAAEENDRRAEFIKAALAEGYSPEQVADFLEKTGGLMDIGRRFVGTEKALHHGRRAEKLLEKGMHSLDRTKREWHGVLSGAAGESDAVKARLLRKLETRMGPEKAKAILADFDARRFYHVPEYKALFPKGKQSSALISGKVGGKDVNITGDQLKAVAKPAAMIGGGAYVGHKLLGGGGGDDGGRRRSGVVVVS